MYIYIHNTYIVECLWEFISFDDCSARSLEIFHPNRSRRSLWSSRDRELQREKRRRALLWNATTQIVPSKGEADLRCNRTCVTDVWLFASCSTHFQGHRAAERRGLFCVCPVVRMIEFFPRFLDRFTFCLDHSWAIIKDPKIQRQRRKRSRRMPFGPFVLRTTRCRRVRFQICQEKKEAKEAPPPDSQPVQALQAVIFECLTVWLCSLSQTHKVLANVVVDSVQIILFPDLSEIYSKAGNKREKPIEKAGYLCAWCAGVFMVFKHDFWYSILCIPLHFVAFEEEAFTVLTDRRCRNTNWIQSAYRFRGRRHRHHSHEETQLGAEETHLLQTRACSSKFSRNQRCLIWIQVSIAFYVPFYLCLHDPLNVTFVYMYICADPSRLHVDSRSGPSEPPRGHPPPFGARTRKTSQNERCKATRLSNAFKSKKNEIQCGQMWSIWIGLNRFCMTLCCQ